MLCRGEHALLHRIAHGRNVTFARMPIARALQLVIDNKSHSGTTRKDLIEPNTLHVFHRPVILQLRRRFDGVSCAGVSMGSTGSAALPWGLQCKMAAALQYTGTPSPHGQ